METRRSILGKALGAVGAALGLKALPAPVHTFTLFAKPLETFAPVALASDKVFIIKAIRCQMYFQNLNDSDYVPSLSDGDEDLV